MHVDPGRINKAETMYVGVVNLIYPTLHSIHILKLSMMGRNLRVHWKSILQPRVEKSVQVLTRTLTTHHQLLITNLLAHRPPKITTQILNNPKTQPTSTPNHPHHQKSTPPAYLYNSFILSNKPHQSQISPSSHTSSN